MSDEIEQHVLDRYEIIQKLGKGAYGVVWKAKDRQNGTIVALKKVYDAFQNSTDAQRTYREVMYLQQLKGHDNIIGLLSIVRAYNNKDLYLVFELMETDLHVVIRAKILKPVHKQFIIYQLFKSLKYMHSAMLVHRDLKPSNMLLNSECLMKLADFGLARSLAFDDGNEPPIVSDYIATRWYRAPEILLGSTSYTFAVDLWSTGCILAEILLEKVLFPGKSSLNQMELIIELLDRPNDEDLDNMKISYANELLPNLKGKKMKSFSKIFENCPPEAIDLLRKLLRYNPKERISVTEVLAHPYFSRFHNEAEETVCPQTVLIPIDDKQKLSLKAYRDAIYDDINHHLKLQRLKSSGKIMPKRNSRLQVAEKPSSSPKPLKAKFKVNVEENKNQFLKIKRSSMKENKKIEKSVSNPKTVLKKKNRSEDNCQDVLKNKVFQQTSKYNQKFEISKSNLNSDQKVLLNNTDSAKKLIIKGFFQKKNPSTYSMGLFKMSKCTSTDKKMNM